MASAARDSRIKEILRSIDESPEADGIKTFSILVAPAVYFVRVEDDFTVYYEFTVEPRDVRVHEIKKTQGGVGNTLNWTPYSR